MDKLQASKQQHHNLCRHLSRASVQGSHHIILLGMDGVIYSPHTLEPLKELGLSTYEATKLSLKLHAHSFRHAYKLASTTHALEKTPLNSHHQDQAWATASNTFGCLPSRKAGVRVDLLWLRFALAPCVVLRFRPLLQQTCSGFLCVLCLPAYHLGCESSMSPSLQLLFCLGGHAGQFLAPVVWSVTMKGICPSRAGIDPPSASSFYLSW
eukprot:278629-Pelagomonas_calceolata.AAC.5